MTIKPQRNSAHRKEDKSKREFEDTIDPYFVTAWNTKDYGIDAIVEITTPLDDLGNAGLESKCFFVQLKSTDKVNIARGFISFSAPTKKIIYWYSYNLPVLLALYDLKYETFYYLWIDEMLISQLDQQTHNWTCQKSITLKIPISNKLVRNTVKLLEDYVSKWKMPSRRKLEPGTYFQLKERGNVYVDSYRALTENFNFQSVNDTVKTLKESLELSLYRIALTGPSRVGKSSLINSLIKKKVSPTGFFQTTGVPIQIIPGIKNCITLYFNDQKSATYPFSLSKVEEYASQDNNTDNKKEVKLISISVNNHDLERGISLFDIPGLDDPSDEVLAYTWQTVKRANAIIYVIDASSAQYGGYIFRNEYKKHISSFRESQDKVFLVFNKVDGLTSEVLDKLRQKVIADLLKHELTDIIGDKLFYLSAENKQTCNGSDTVNDLNEKLWDFILDENKSGIVKLNLVNQELFSSTKSLLEILNARLLDDAKRAKLQTAIDQIKLKAQLLNEDISIRQIDCKKLLMNSIDIQYHAILTRLENYLKKIPLSENLPSSAEIKRILLEKLNESIEKSNIEYVAQLNQLKNHIDIWVEQNLSQLREILKHNSKKKIIDFTEIETFECPQIDYSSAWGMGFIGMVAASVIAPAYIITAGIIGFFGSLFTTEEIRRAKQISKILEKSKENYDIAFKKIKKGYEEIFIEHICFLDRYVTRRVDHYFQDIEKQLSLLNSKDSKDVIESFKKSVKRIEELQLGLIDFDAELRSFHFLH